MADRPYQIKGKSASYAMTFKNRAILVHGDKYDYRMSIYVTAKTKVTIFCKKHGLFFSQSPDVHLRGIGCPHCGGSNLCDTEGFIKKSKKVHGENYDYDRVIYVNSHSHVEIYCKKCKDYFLKTPTHHLSGQGCPECAGYKNGTTESFVKKAKKVHGDLYDYTLTHYTKNSDPVYIYCIEHRQYFLKSPANHLKGQGCPSCSSSGFKKNLPALLYYLRVGGAYKIGITNRTVLARFSPKDLEVITILKVWEFELGKDALAKEQWILKTFKNARYEGEPLLSSGNSELFNYDILGIDNGA